MANVQEVGECAATATTSPSLQVLEWSVYEDEWPMTTPHEHDAQQPLRHVPPFTAPHAHATLRGGGVGKTAMLRRGAQGAVYAAVDTTATTTTTVRARMCDTDGGVCAVKRLFTQQSDFGRRGVAETVLREATLLRHVNACERRRRCRCRDTVTSKASNDNESNEEGHDAMHVRQEQDGGGGDGGGIDDSAGVVCLHRIVEAPHHELCLVLQYCPLDLQRIVRPRRATTHALPSLLQQQPAPQRPRHGRLSHRQEANNDTTQTAPAQQQQQQQLHSNNTQRCPLLAEPSLVRYLLRRLLRIVLFLHEDCDVLHRDIKLSNFLVSATGAVRLSDFGSARLRTSAEQRTPPPQHDNKHSDDNNNNSSGSRSGGTRPCRARAHTPASLRTTLLYQPPEGLLGDCHYDTAYDVWSLGVVFAELLLQRHLFARAGSELALLSAISRLLGDVAHARAHDSGAAAAMTTGTLPHKFTRAIVSEQGYDLLRRMLCVLPAQRITLREALRHPFLCFDGDDADDAAGRSLWLRKVAEVLHSHNEHDASGACGVRGDAAGAEDDDDGEDEEGQDVHARRRPAHRGAAMRMLHMAGDDDDEDDEDGSAQLACELVSPVDSDDVDEAAVYMPPPPPSDLLTRSP